MPQGVLLAQNLMLFQARTTSLFSSVLLVALPLPGVTAGCTSPQCRDDYDPATRVFHRIYWGLDAVPRDVPDATLELYLYGNNIAVIPAGTFLTQKYTQRTVF